MTTTIRSAALADIGAAVQVHCDAFPGFLLTRLGPRFLAHMYRGFIEVPSGSLLLAQADGEIVGLLAGTGAPLTFFATVRRRQGLVMAAAALPGLFRHPLWIGERLLAALLYGGDRPPSLPGYWLLSSLAVLQRSAGRGVGRALVGHFCENARGAGAPGVYLVTDQDDNEATQRFYAKLGFVAHATQRRRSGRRLLVLARSFDR